jgi:hypothetical protein
MKLGMGLYRSMLTPEYVRFAKQAGATHIVAHMPGNFKRDTQKVITSDDSALGFGVDELGDPIWSYEGLRDLKAMINAEGMELEALENFAPQHWYDVLLDGPRRQPQIEQLKPTPTSSTPRTPRAPSRQFRPTSCGGATRHSWTRCCRWPRRPASSWRCTPTTRRCRSYAARPAWSTHPTATSACWT